MKISSLNPVHQEQKDDKIITYMSPSEDEVSEPIVETKSCDLVKQSLDSLVDNELDRIGLKK